MRKYGTFALRKALSSKSSGDRSGRQRALLLRSRVVERARSYRRRGSQTYRERTVGRSQDGRLGAATTFEAPYPQISSDTLTNNTAARKACALPASRKARAFGRLRAACVRYCADLGCPRITPGSSKTHRAIRFLADLCPVRFGIRRGVECSRTASEECCLEKEV